MAVRVLYFAALRDALPLAEESVALPAGVETMAALRAWLGARGEAWAPLVTWKTLRCARNQTLCAWDEPVQDGDEVAFFPPVTGG